MTEQPQQVEEFNKKILLMHCFKNFLLIFVVQTVKSQEYASTLCKTKTKNEGEHTGASPAVFPLCINCDGSVCSDSPSIHNLKILFIMQTDSSQSSGNDYPVKPHKIVDNFLFNDQPENFKESLQLIFKHWLLTEDLEPSNRGTIIYHYNEIMHLLDELQKYDSFKNRGKHEDQ